MKHYKNFKLYIPGDEFAELKQFSVAFIKSECGLDWYSAMKEFSLDTTKIVYDENGLIVLQSDDATSLWPNGWSVVEIDKTSEDLIGKIYTSTGKIKSYSKSSEELKNDIDYELTKLKSYASSIIQPLQYAVDLDEATATEIEYLTAMKRYVIQLSRVVDQEGYPKKVQYPSLPAKRK